jgi:hypothetical protein
MQRKSIIRIVVSFLIMIVVVTLLYRSMATMTGNPQIQIQSTVKPKP